MPILNTPPEMPNANPLNRGMRAMVSFGGCCRGGAPLVQVLCGVVRIIGHMCRTGLWTDRTSVLFVGAQPQSPERRGGGGYEGRIGT